MSDAELSPTEQAARVSRAVSLMDLRLMEVHAELLDGSGYDNYRVDMQVDLSPDLQDDLLLFGVRFALTLHPTTAAEQTAAAETDDGGGNDLEADDGVPAYTATGGFQLVYRVSGDVNPDDLEPFGEMSAMYSAWPYARELFTTLTSRAGLTPLVLRSFLAPVLDS